MMHPDDIPGDHGRLWDADPDVCCAAFQLGACVHTEAPEGEETYDETYPAPPVPAVSAHDDDNEPF